MPNKVTAYRQSFGEIFGRAVKKSVCENLFILNNTPRALIFPMPDLFPDLLSSVK